VNLRKRKKIRRLKDGCRTGAYDKNWFLYHFEKAALQYNWEGYISTTFWNVTFGRAACDANSAEGYTISSVR
jgi:hypothetical protein